LHCITGIGHTTPVCLATDLAKKTSSASYQFVIRSLINQ
jgi:hypothetical protein